MSSHEAPAACHTVKSHITIRDNDVVLSSHPPSLRTWPTKETISASQTSPSSAQTTARRMCPSRAFQSVCSRTSKSWRPSVLSLRIMTLTKYLLTTVRDPTRSSRPVPNLNSLAPSGGTTTETLQEVTSSPTPRRRRTSNVTTIQATRLLLHPIRSLSTRSSSSIPRASP